MRVYLPLTLPALPAGMVAGLADPVGFAVTDSLRAAFPDEGDEEVLEYEALLLAAAESAAQLSGPPRRTQRRLVVAADAPDGAVEADPQRGPGAVRIVGGLGPELFAALHVDEALDDPAPSWAERDLLWYAPQEADDLLAEAGLR